MAIITTCPFRARTECKTFTGSLAAIETAYAAYELSKAEDETKTWEVHIKEAYYDGTNHVLIAEAQYTERNEDATGQVPIPTV